VAGHGLVQAALFLCTCIVFTLAAFGLADLPPFATFLSKGYIDDSAWAHGLPWVMGVFVACSVLVGGAVFRVAGGVFYGLGDPPTEDAGWPRWPPRRLAKPSRTRAGRRSP
jgi:formate hydrogenlyase subunit 3/multisubunit Na+/H+ antiporter MnhD subunit